MSSLCLLLCAAPSSASSVSWTTDELKESNASKRYDVEAEYPQFRDASGKPLTDLNSAVKKIVDEQVAEAKSSFEENNQEIFEVKELRDMKSSFQMGYEADLVNDRLVSIVMSSESMSVGAAHPSHWRRTFVYSLNPLKRLTLEDIFKNDSDYLQTISKISISELKKKAGEGTDEE